MIELGVNVDHVATIRQARCTYEPDPLWAAIEAQLGGADCITMHLREDRRHVQNHDIERVRTSCQVKLNMEMAATDEMVDIACRIRPHMATLVPEGRQEITTEGGLDVVRQIPRLKQVLAKLTDAAIRVSAFIDAESTQVDAAAQVGFAMCEIHTGPFATVFHEHGGHIQHPQVHAELNKIAAAGRQTTTAGMRFNAGHALTYTNVQAIAAITGICELHIGHSLVSRAVFVGLRQAVREMKHLIRQAQAAHG